MKKIYLLMPFLAFALQSCSTLFNAKTTTVRVYADQPISLTYQDSVVTDNRQTHKIKPERSKDSLTLKVSSKNVSKTFKFPSQKSFKFWGNIICPYNNGVGMLVDLTNNKRFNYKNEYFFEVDTIQNTINYQKYGNRKNEVRVTLSLPYVNSFFIKGNTGGQIGETGFFGLSGGLEYYYKRNQFLHLRASIFTNFPIPFPAPLSNDNQVNASNINLTHNYLFGKLAVGYGLGYAEHRVFINRENEADREFYSNTISLNVPVYYHFNQHFRVGAIYRTSVLDIGEKDIFGYQHSISLDFLWSLNLLRINKK